MPTTEISNQKYKFRFGESADSGIYCKVTVYIRELQYDSGENYYDITYKYKLGADAASKFHHPFYHSGKNLFDDSVGGDILVKNSLSEKLVEYLCMDFADLKKICGRVAPEEYKKSVIQSIALLWD